VPEDRNRAGFQNVVLT